jgi:hypothetical protein
MKNSVRQTGAIVLAMSLILLFLITIVTFAVTRNISVEQKVANNEFRSRLSFEAAEAGIAAALEYIRDLPKESPLTNLSGDSGNGRFEVRLTYNLADDAVNIVSQGFSDDNTATRKIYIVAKKADGVGGLPEIPLIATDAVGQGGAYTIINPEGGSTIWSGQAVGEQGEGSDTYIASPFDVSFPSCMDSPLSCAWVDTSNSSMGSGLDVIENDTSLGNLTIDDLFEIYFGMPPALYKSTVAEIVTDENSSDFINTVGKVIWIDDADGDGVVELGGNLVVGCETDTEKFTPPPGSVIDAKNPLYICPDSSPSANPDDLESTITIINGDVKFTGDAHFSGITFVRGQITGSGGPTFIGAMLAEGEGEGKKNSFKGNVTIIYHSGYIGGAQDLGAYFAAPGSWRDFEKQL